ncbi:MAG: potassium transporter Kup [Alphaproteobacteria bacterium]
MSHTRSGLPLLMLGALGVVFGDIGTSPLYTLRECFHTLGLPLAAPEIMGVLSLIVWALFLVVTVEYVMFVLRADNRGEGGIFALTALAFNHVDAADSRLNKVILTAGMAGAGLFYGDAIITPAISVLSAVEGLGVVAPAFSHSVVPLSMLILIGLFSFQKFGTGKVGNLFGPVMLLWFGVLATLGLMQVMKEPDILHALNPIHALNLWVNHPLQAFFVMGSVVLAITGAEALYADMGHFGRTPIRLVWLGFVLPALILNYFGQGTLVLHHPETLANPFYLLAPEALRFPLVLLATLATVIASQAVISGAFSLTSQAIQMGYLPRMTVLYTSASEVGQVYLPALNALLLVAVLFLVVVFQTSSNLAAAYGIAVTGTMVITTLLTALVLVRRLGWNPLWMIAFVGIFTTIDTTLFLSNTLKIPHGGWFPLVFGGMVFYLMHTWYTGRKVASAHHAHVSPHLDEFLAHLPKKAYRTPQTAVYLTNNLNVVPPALTYNLNHNNVIHEQVILLKIGKARIPKYPEAERVRLTFLPHGFIAINTTFGFMEQPDVPAILERCKHDYHLDIAYPRALSYILSNHTYVPSNNPSLTPLQERVFVLLQSLALSAISYFKLPREQVVEIGTQVEI